MLTVGLGLVVSELSLRRTFVDPTLVKLSCSCSRSAAEGFVTGSV